MDYEAGDLIIDIETNSYYVQAKKRFLAYASVLLEDKNACFDFAYDMSYGHIGEHRSHRSGGTSDRKKGQIFINTFQGKMAEFAVYRYLQSRNIKLNRPDTTRYELGVWDSFDLDCQGKHLSVKSTKSYGDLLLLETNDWNDDGEYIPNQKRCTSKYDYTILVRFFPDGERIMADNGLIDQSDEKIPFNIKDILIEKVRNIEWYYDLPGFIYYTELLKMIRERKIIPKNAKLNGKKPMDAKNYYFQTGNMHSMIDIYTLNRDTLANHKNDVLKRTCPACGNELVIRTGPHGDFWGCKGFKGFATNSCRYKEPIEPKD